MQPEVGTEGGSEWCGKRFGLDEGWRVYTPASWVTLDFQKRRWGLTPRPSFAVSERGCFVSGRP